MHAYNERNGRELSSNVKEARNLFERMRGLLGRRKLEQGESLWIRPCKSIHTIGMRFPIDAIFLDEKNVAIHIRRNLAPHRMTGIHFRAVSVLELPAGTLTATDTNVGDPLRIA